MHRIDDPWSPANVFTHGDPRAFVRPSKVRATWLTEFQEELCAIVEGAGLTLEKGNAAQLIQALDLLYGSQEEVTGDLLINGDFEVWQRGTAFTGIFTGGYGCDRWRVTPGSGAGWDLFRRAFTPGQTDVPGEPAHYAELEISGTPSSAPSFIQRIEDVRNAAGGPIAYRFWARVQSGTLQVTPGFIQNFGTGGSTKVTTNDSPVTFTTTWQEFTGFVSLPSISGKTLGEDAQGSPDHFLVFGFEFPTGVDFTIELARCQVNLGEEVQSLNPIPFQETIRRCQRYFQKSYPLNIPAGTVTDVGKLVSIETVPDAFGIARPLAVAMRTLPVVTWYDPENGNADRVRWLGDTLTSVLVDDTVGEDATSTGYPTSGASARTGLVSAHFTAEAEL